EERIHLGFGHLLRMADAMEPDVSLRPVVIGVLGADAVVSGTAGVAEAIEQLRLWGVGRGGHRESQQMSRGRYGFTDDMMSPARVVSTTCAQFTAGPARRAGAAQRASRTVRRPATGPTGRTSTTLCARSAPPGASAPPTPPSPASAFAPGCPPRLPPRTAPSPSAARRPAPRATTPPPGPTAAAALAL